MMQPNDALIDDTGRLHVYRPRAKSKTAMKVATVPQLCPYGYIGNATGCGDWCPLFHELIDSALVALGCTKEMAYATYHIIEDLRKKEPDVQSNKANG